MKIKLNNVSNQRKPIMNRLQKYALGSQSLAVLSWVLSQTAICSAGVINLNLDGPNVGETFVAVGGGTAGDTAGYLLDASINDIDDVIAFTAYSSPTLGPQLFLSSLSLGSEIFSAASGFLQSAHFYSVGSTVDGSLDTRPDLTYAFVYRSLSGGALGDWTIDRNGAIGFKTGDNQFGFFNVDWDVSAKTLTILGGSIESTASTGIVVTAVAVPEPSEYAAALGLGALGLAYYRRRPGNKTRAKK